MEVIVRFMDRYTAALHAMQTGVLHLMHYEPPERMTSETSPKHLRVGVNAAMSDHGALAKLLISKGVFTDEEYLEAIAVGMEEEKDRYEKRLQDLTGGGTKITLG